MIATAQGLIAIALLLWATMARFGAPQQAPPPLQAGRGGLLQNMARLIEFTGHQGPIITRYIQETVRDVARAPIVGLAVPWANIRDALAGLSWSGEIVIDATNAVLFPSLEPVPLGGLTSSEIVAQLAPGARVVKAANTFGADVLASDPREAGGRRVMFVSGDDAQAKRAVGQLFDAAGYFPIDVGDLATGGAMQQAGGPLARHNLVRMPAPWE